MTNLEKRAMARPPLSYETVESIWDGSGPIAARFVKALCESHERLRAELEGSEILRADAEKELATMKGNALTEEHKDLLRGFYTILRHKQILPPMDPGIQDKLANDVAKILGVSR